MAKRRGNHEGTIYKRANGRWQAQVTIDGKRLAKTFGTHTECRAWIKDISGQIEKGLSISNSKSDLGSYLRKWLQDVKPTLKYKTWYQYEDIVRNHILPDLGKVKMQDLRPDMIQDLYTAKSNQGIGK